MPNESSLSNIDGLRGKLNQIKNSKDQYNPQQMQQRLGRMMGQLVPQSQRYMQGHEEELTLLAKEVLMEEYGDVLDGVVLNLNLTSPQEVRRQYNEPQTIKRPDRPTDLTEDDKTEINKKSIINAILQGNGLNTKYVMHSDLVKNKLTDIYGNQADQVLSTWNDISKIADDMTNNVPDEHQLDMMQNAPMQAGMESVTWEENTDPETKEERPYIPHINVWAVDFPMLLHEAVKGIYEYISANSITDDKELEEKIKKNTSGHEDELEGFQYGPELAADLRDFINESPNIEKYNNLKEYVWGKMVTLPAKEFLDLFQGIIDRTPSARRAIDSMVASTIQDLDQYYADLKEYEEKMKAADEYEREHSNKPVEPKIETPTTEPVTAAEVSYAKMSERELMDLFDQALDSGDTKRMDMIGAELSKRK